jgi:Membrane domain of glycerophosphoryl diester phosphodiesterase
MSGPQAWTAPDSAMPSEGPPQGLSERSGVGAPDHGKPAIDPDGTAPAAGEGGLAAVPAPEGGDGSGAGPAGGGTPIADRAELLGGEIPFRPLGIAEILDASIACIRRNPRAVLGLSVLITGIIQVFNTVGGYLLLSDQAQEELAPEPLMRSVGAQFTLGLLSLLMSAYGTLLLAGFLGPVVSRTLFGQPASLRRVWRDTRPAFARLLCTAAVVLVLSILGAVLPLLPFVLLLAGDGPPVAGVLAAIVGFPVALVLMVWLYVLWVLALPAVVLERRTVVGALGRAYQLSRRGWWRTCGTLLLALLITIFMGFLALRIPFLFLQMLLFANDGNSALLGSLAVDTLGRIVSWSLITPFDAGVIALLYVDRRMRREGFDLDVQTRNRSGAAGDATGSVDPDHPLDVWRPVTFPPVNGSPPAPPGLHRPFVTPAHPSPFPPTHGPQQTQGHPIWPQPPQTMPPRQPPQTMPPGQPPQGIPPRHGAPEGGPSGPGMPRPPHPPAGRTE